MQLEKEIELQKREGLLDGDLDVGDPNWRGQWKIGVGNDGEPARQDLNPTRRKQQSVWLPLPRELRSILGEVAAEQNLGVSRYVTVLVWEDLVRKRGPEVERFRDEVMSVRTNRRAQNKAIRDAARLR